MAVIDNLFHLINLLGNLGNDIGMEKKVIAEVFGFDRIKLLYKVSSELLPDMSLSCKVLFEFQCPFFVIRMDVGVILETTTIISNTLLCCF